MNRLKIISEKVSKTMILAIAVLILGLAITYYQNKLNGIEIPTKVTAIVTTKDILKGNEIKGSDLAEKEVYKVDKLDGGIVNMEELIGKVSLTDIVKGKEIIKKEITAKDKWIQEDEREMGITFNDFTDIVGGKVLPGDIVDIVLSYPYDPKIQEIKEPEVVIENLELIEIYNSDNISYVDSKDKNSFKPITVLVKLTKDEENKLDKAEKLGRIYMRRHGNSIKAETKSSAAKENKVVITGGVFKND